MRVHGLQFSTRLGLALLSVIGIAAAAHADAATDLAAPIKISSVGSTQRCSDDYKSGLPMLRFPTGTTFLMTDAGLIVLDQPAAANTSQPDWPNTGN
jgi:hypothetical protein